MNGSGSWDGAPALEAWHASHDFHSYYVFKRYSTPPNSTLLLSAHAVNSWGFWFCSSQYLQHICSTIWSYVVYIWLQEHFAAICHHPIDAVSSSMLEEVLGAVTYCLRCLCRLRRSPSSLLMKDDNACAIIDGGIHAILPDAAASEWSCAHQASC